MSVHEFEFATLMFDEENMVLFFRVKQGITVDIHEITEMISYAQQIAKERKHFGIVNFGMDVTSTAQARELYSESLYIQKYRIADAFVVGSLAIRITANFFIKVTKPAIQTKVFNSEEDALKWIKTIPLK